ncbi:TPA: ead/Ea22-like family protein [Escherichia coli]
MTIDYQALREIAKKATQGEWSAFISPGTGTYAVHTPGDKRCEDVIKWTGFDGQKNAENNARYIAAFNPEVVQALLDELERNQQYIKRRDQENEDIALTVGKLRVELEAAKSKLNEQREYYEGVIADGSKRIAELEEQEMLARNCAARRPGRDPYEMAEYIALLIRQDDARVRGRIKSISRKRCGKCGERVPVNSCPCNGDSQCWVTKGWHETKLIV